MLLLAWLQHHRNLSRGSWASLASRTGMPSPGPTAPPPHCVLLFRLTASCPPPHCVLPSSSASMCPAFFLRLTASSPPPHCVLPSSSASLRPALRFTASCPPPQYVLPSASLRPALRLTASCLLPPPHCVLPSSSASLHPAVRLIASCPPPQCVLPSASLRPPPHCVLRLTASCLLPPPYFIQPSSSLRPALSSSRPVFFLRLTEPCPVPDLFALSSVPRPRTEPSLQWRRRCPGRHAGRVRAGAHSVWRRAPAMVVLGVPRGSLRASAAAGAA
jgi:hypothetical protein